MNTQMVSGDDSRHAIAVREIQTERSRKRDRPTCTVDGRPARVLGYWKAVPTVYLMNPVYYPGTGVVMSWTYGEGFETDWQTVREAIENGTDFRSADMTSVGTMLF